MRDIIADIDRWLSQGEDVALATVIQTWGSSPRGVGSCMAITGSGRIAGSVSGGCVEGAVVEAASDALRERRGRLLHFGIADEDAWEVGLACGGSIDVFVNALDNRLYRRLNASLQTGEPVTIATVIDGPEPMLGQQAVMGHDKGWSYSTLAGAIDSSALAATNHVLESGQSCRITLAGSDSAQAAEIFVHVLLPPPMLVAVGGAHISIALVSIARALGYRTIVVDPRRAFASEERFPHADEIIQLWPDKAFEHIGLTRSAAVAVLTHDPKIDDPALLAALRSPAFYIGALGSRTTQEKRRQRLLQAGLAEPLLDHLHGPIGLNIGARTPEEIALAVMAEIIAEWNHSLSGIPDEPHKVSV